nr:hypothetical protein [Escherichia coli]
MDNTPPTVAITFDGKPVKDDTVVYGLETSGSLWQII